MLLPLLPTSTLFLPQKKLIQMQLHLAQIDLLMEMELKAGHLELVEIMLM